MSLGLCRTEWVLEVDADEWITKELADEIRETIADPKYDVYDLNVENYIGGKLIVHGWGGGSFGKKSYNGLFRNGTKTYAPRRAHAHVSFEGTICPTALKNPVVHHIFSDVSAIIRCLDRYSDYRAKDLAENNEKVLGTWGAARKFLSRFWKIYVVRGARKEKGYGLVLALCAAMYPLVSHIKARYEETPSKS